MVMAHIYAKKRKFRDQLVLKIEWKQSDGQTDAIPIASPSRITRSVILGRRATAHHLMGELTGKVVDVLTQLDSH